MMFRNIIKRFDGMIPTPLGRWCRTTDIQNNIKVDWANTDHCGTCLFKKTSESQLVVQKEVKSVIRLPSIEGKQFNKIK